MKRLPLILVLLLLGGCAYYNGMYNTKRLARRARQAEKEGRTFDATSLWGQVGVKAESVLAQHPNSKWADEARLLQGTSLVKLRNCAQGVVPLEQVLSRSRDSRLIEEATALVGGCRTQMGDPAGAMAAYSRLTGSTDPERRRLARFAYGQAQRVAGNFEAAFSELESTDYPGAQGERAAALAGLGRLPEALVVIDTLLGIPDSTVAWDSIAAYISRHDTTVGTQVIDRIAETNGLPAPLRVRLLLADADRWETADTLKSIGRLTLAQRLAGSGPLASEVRFESARQRLHRVKTSDDLKRVLDQLSELTDGSDATGPRAAQLASSVSRVAIATDSVSPGSPAGDLRVFLAGEVARDSLDAQDFAVSQFQRIPAEWPASPFAPKAMLALIQLQPALADSLRGVLLERYSTSPYVIMVQGGESPDYLVLEDSLRSFALGFRPGSVTTPPPRPVRRPVSPGTQVDQ